MTKEERIEEIRQDLSKVVEVVSDRKKSLAISLINQIAFMHASIEELEEIINANGYVEVYQNGANQSGVKKSSEVEVFNSMSQRFNQAVSTLLSMIPDETKKETGGSLLQFISEKPSAKKTK